MLKINHTYKLQLIETCIVSRTVNSLAISRTLLLQEATLLVTLWCCLSIWLSWWFLGNFFFQIFFFQLQKIFPTFTFHAFHMFTQNFSNELWVKQPNILVLRLFDLKMPHASHSAVFKSNNLKNIGVYLWSTYVLMEQGTSARLCCWKTACVCFPLFIFQDSSTIFMHSERPANFSACTSLRFIVNPSVFNRDSLNFQACKSRLAVIWIPS